VTISPESETCVHVQALGHVVLKSRNLERAEVFYSELLGMQVVLRIPEPRMTFFRIAGSGNHHDFALFETPPCPALPSPDQNATGLAHVAFKIGPSADALRRTRTVLDDAGIRCLYEADRAFAKSLHVLDPDGNEVELYAETHDA
jgi:catechol-2,3-dioxygenase